VGEERRLAKIATPNETLLVADSLTGQDAVETAQRFHDRLPLTGLILTRMDGDGRGGAALSMRAVTGLPIKFLGTGEKLDGLDAFDARGLGGRMLGQGDIVSLVEKAGDQMDADKAEKMAKKLAKGQFDLDDLAQQLQQMQKMGGLGGIMGMLPGAKKAKQALDASGMDDKVILRQAAIISSMTKKERAKPALLNASRRKRIAAGAGVEVQDVNRVLRMPQTDCRPDDENVQRRNEGHDENDGTSRGLTWRSSKNGRGSGGAGRQAEPSRMGRH